MPSRFLKHACSILAICKLTGKKDSEWVSEELVDHIEANDGLVDYDLLAEHAPIKVWRGSYEIEDSRHKIEIQQGNQKRVLRPDEQVAISIRVSATRSHMETIKARDLWQYVDDLCEVITLEEEDNTPRTIDGYEPMFGSDWA